MLGSFASIANMSVKNIWSVGVFVLVVFVIIGTSILHEKKTVRRDYQVAVESYDVIKMKGLKLRKIETTDGKDSRIDDFEIKAAPSFRIPPHRMWHVVGIHSPRDREYRSIVERETDKGIDGGGLSYRGAAERNTTEVSNELKDTKKSYKKLKLIRTRADYKKEWKNKEQQSTYSNGDKSIGVTKKTIGRRQVNYYFANTDEERINRSRRCAMHAKNLKDDKSDYYSMRKAVMDKFYARQKEIAKKYAKRVTAAPIITTTPKYISYNLQEKFNKSSTTKIETNDIQNVSAKIPTNNVQKINKTLDKGRRNFVDDNAILILPTAKSNRTKVIETPTISNDTDQVTSDTSNVYYVNHLNGEVDNESNESNKSVSTNIACIFDKLPLYFRYKILNKIKLNRINVLLEISCKR